MPRLFWLAGLVLAAMGACAPVPPEIAAHGALGRNDFYYWGTGFFIDRAGHILTAHHIVRDCGRIEVVGQGRRQPALLIASSTKDDLSLLRVSENFGAPLSLATGASDWGGRFVAVLGYAALRDPNLSFAFNSMVVDARAARHIALISDAAPGYSGSPVVTRDGSVIGVLESKVTQARAPAAPGRLNEIRLAVSSAAALEFLRSQHVAGNAADEAAAKPLIERLALAEVKVECHGDDAAAAQAASHTP